MKTHFLRLIQRGIIKMPVIYSINFLGLVLSMGVVIILFGYYLGEINANTFNQNIDNTYIICSEKSQNQLSTYTAAILKEHVEEKIPEVIKVVRMRSPWDETTLQVDENPPIISSIIFVDSTFIDVFSYQCIAGELEIALNTPMSIVLSKNEAQKLFGNISPIGETVKIDNNHLLTVRAVINEPSEKSSLSFKAIVPMNSISQISPNGDELTNWMFANFTTFVLLEKNAIPNEVEKKLAQLYPESEEEPKIFLQSFSSLYFSDINISKLSYLKTGNKSTTMILGVVAIIIFLIGIINYLNLSFSMTI